MDSHSGTSNTIDRGNRKLTRCFGTTKCAVKLPGCAVALGCTVNSQLLQLLL
jgi:hypothetical protein